VFLVWLVLLRFEKWVGQRGTASRVGTLRWEKLCVGFSGSIFFGIPQGVQCRRATGTTIVVQISFRRTTWILNKASTPLYGYKIKTCVLGNSDSHKTNHPLPGWLALGNSWWVYGPRGNGCAYVRGGTSAWIDHEEKLW
jgi:hypothetical protein